MVTFSNNKDWFDFANSISRGFFADCLEVMQNRQEYKSLQEQIEMAVKQSTFLLDLQNSSIEELKLFREVANMVIALNEERQGSNFHRPDFFSIYMSKIILLPTFIEEAIKYIEGE